MRRHRTRCRDATIFQTDASSSPAKSRREKGRTKSCGKYSNSKTGAVMKLKVKGYSQTVVLYDRFTGKRVAKKVFKPKMKCPKRFKRGASVKTVYPDWKDTKKWFEAQAAKL